MRGGGRVPPMNPGRQLGGDRRGRQRRTPPALSIVRSHGACLTAWAKLTCPGAVRWRRRRSPSMSADYTPRQGQYLAFIYYYTKIHGVPPAEADMQRYFRVSPPAVHEMVKTLERQGLIAREPGKPRSIRLLLTRARLPDLE